MSNIIKNTKNNFLQSVSELLIQSRQKVTTAINISMVYTYFEIGRMIVEEEQNGKEKAGYGQNLITELSEHLTSQFGKGFSKTNIKQMRKFYLEYSQKAIGQTVSDLLGEKSTNTKNYDFSLSWSHYLKLMRIKNIQERQFYEIEARENNWSLSELNRQFDSSLYERLVLSRDKEKIKELSIKGHIVETPKDILKEPYVLEFLGLPELSSYSEQDLESKIIDNLQKFLLELGKGFTFVGRQVRISYDEEHFFIDLVFYNRLLKCFVLFDLKIGKIKHQDIGQMQMYVNYYDRKIKLDDENKTIGILLCKDKKQSLVEMTLPEDNEQMFAVKYETVLPSKEDLQRLIEIDKS
ncbi:PDDEXK nuclease domain-containing protein [Pasteurella atlantica]|uniref:PDDEXK nuclease domain-containing protein n=1 Tax=Phocoenobacter skyensis TaxID=97481 RepID=A0A1H7ZP89_9PAST|nr:MULTISPECIES: PDDEXK nuclease domain-containing protein [Pasteurella]MDP8033033.1 PDDEXK nuclease domain-containing protein [Pasteurella atlantica]MDP8034970.1 PDDEXK nuclease domain-containing protein [Pasteurella atlantica]MDP8037070.1 PDDEXK nuclease domain-containing protein [Pasteurella atlantica]MDP8047404.1 PDDEXK nuclease domain-containing protein [Pasteurella atlantica]MDP8049073.1 PDDEXK nuclease domain-containing protein [Pasteurella atlantica]